MKAKFIIPLILFLALPILSFSQKAYDEVIYKGTGKAFSVTFHFADGYPEASKVYTIHLKTKKKAHYAVQISAEDGKHLKMYHAEKDGKTYPDYFILKEMGGYPDAPNTITAVFYDNGKTENIELKRK